MLCYLKRIEYKGFFKIPNNIGGHNKTWMPTLVIHLNIDMFLIKKLNPFEYLALLEYPDIIAGINIGV